MAMHMVVAAVCLLQGTAQQAHAFGPGSSGELRVGSWNVLYKALDDAAGQAAIIKTMDTADAARNFDFFGVVEAQGDSKAGNFSSWITHSSMLQRLAHVSGASGYEVIALFYDAAHWTANYTLTGEFEPGRPYLLAQFLSTAQARETIWVMVVHLNHYFLRYPDKIDPVYPGSVMANAMANASRLTGDDIARSSVVMVGDFNEFEWADFEAPYKADAQRRMAPLWDGYFSGRMRDAVPPRTVSCCTKWAAADRTEDTFADWRFEYDHVFYSANLEHVAEAGPAAKGPFLEYAYPGLAGACADAACTGEDPPGNVTALHQGSWHRAVHAVLSSKASVAPV